MLFIISFIFLFASYLLKPVRETLVLVNGGAEMRSYVIAAQAMLLLAVLPAYGLLFKHSDKQVLMQTIIGCMAGFLCFFYMNTYIFLVQMPMAFYIWMGLFGVLIVAQFWAFTSDLYSEGAGKRLFAIIALGASSGAWAGSLAAKKLFEAMGPEGLVLIAIAMLAMTMLVVPRIERTIPKTSHSSYTPEQEIIDQHIFSGFRLVFASRYLLAIAIFVVLFNWVNSTGDFILSAWVDTRAEEIVGTDPEAKSNYIGTFYAEFYFMMSLVGFLIQALLVSRIIKYFGVSLALTILPIIIIMGYLGIMIFPIFTFFYVFRIAENSIGYSLQNTVRQVLFLPTSKQEKYEARSVIETFFWRIGDVLQALVVYIGYNLLDMEWKHYAIMNLVLTVIMLAMALRIGYHYRKLHANWNPDDLLAEIHNPEQEPA
ncbi:MAG: hypothetical protein V7711_14045 [Pseudomonadales bacterium]